MSGAAITLQAAAVAALKASAPGIGGVYDGPPVQAAFPYAVVECGAEGDWGHKSAVGRELRLAVTLRDAGERPARVQQLADQAEAALAGIGPALDGWRLVTFRFLRSRAVKERNGSWAVMIEYRARMLEEGAAL
jgi:hypothetical protein